MKFEMDRHFLRLIQTDVRLDEKTSSDRSGEGIVSLCHRIWRRQEKDSVVQCSNESVQSGAMVERVVVSVPFDVGRVLMDRSHRNDCFGHRLNVISTPIDDNGLVSIYLKKMFEQRSDLAKR